MVAVKVVLERLLVVAGLVRGLVLWQLLLVAIAELRRAGGHE